MQRAMKTQTLPFKFPDVLIDSDSACFGSVCLFMFCKSPPLLFLQVWFSQKTWSMMSGPRLMNDPGAQWAFCDVEISSPYPW